MTDKKIYRTVELALEAVAREQWATSPLVSRALLGCVRTQGIVRQHMLKRGVSLSVFEDVVCEIAVVMQMKMLERLEKVSDVYFVIYRVSQLVVSNWGKRAAHSPAFEEVSLSTLEGEEGEGAGLLDRLSSAALQGEMDDPHERRIDLQNAKRRFAEKLSLLGWPQDILRERGRLGRPPKASQVTDTPQP